MPSKAKKCFYEFIDLIPDHVLDGIPDTRTTLFRTQDLRLDMQGMTTKTPKRHRLHIQVNGQVSVTTLEALRFETISEVEVLQDDPGTPASIKQ